MRSSSRCGRVRATTQRAGAAAASLGEGAPSGRAASSCTTSAATSATAPARSCARRRRLRATPYCVGPPAPTTSAARLERVFAFAAVARHQARRALRLSGQPVPGHEPAHALNVAGLLALRALGDQYGLRFPGRHGNLTEANWDGQIAVSKILGQDHIGESGCPAAPASCSTLRSDAATPRSCSTGSASARSRPGSGRRTSTTTSRSSSTRAASTTACSRARGRSSWSAPTRAGSSRRSTSAGPSAALATAPRRRRRGRGRRARG